MDTWARATPEDREALFNRTSATKGISSEIIEKDFWVCWMLHQGDMGDWHVSLFSCFLAAGGRRASTRRPCQAAGGGGYSQQRSESLTHRRGASEYLGDVRLQVNRDAEFSVGMVKLSALALGKIILFLHG